jgi:hypothetical protein
MNGRLTQIFAPLNMDLIFNEWDDEAQCASPVFVTVKKATLRKHMKAKNAVRFVPSQIGLKSDEFTRYYWEGRPITHPPRGLRMTFESLIDGVEGRDVLYAFREPTSWPQCERISQQINTWLKELKEGYETQVLQSNHDDCRDTRIKSNKKQKTNI